MPRSLANSLLVFQNPGESSSSNNASQAEEEVTSVTQCQRVMRLRVSLPETT